MGDTVGETDGCAVVGEIVDGASLGLTVGVRLDGLTEGDTEGKLLGTTVGVSVGDTLGDWVGVEGLLVTELETRTSTASVWLVAEQLPSSLSIPPQ